MQIYNGISGQGYRYRHQRFTEHEAAIVALGIEAHWSDARIARVLGRPQHAVRTHRRRRGMLKQRGRGLWYALAIMVASAFDSPVSAHDPGEPNAEWYQSLTRPDVGGSCCSKDKDCRPVEYRMSPPVADGDSAYEAAVNGGWLRIPQRAVIPKHDNPTGGGVLCKTAAGSRMGPLPASDYILCFIPSDDL